MYSSIEIEERQTVIEKCYAPLLDLASSGIPIGIEATGLTLEIINDISPGWIRKLTELINHKKIEFIGSGYAQIIGPLVPEEINFWNQKIGINIYRELLNINPDIALVNEMAYSSGMVQHYLQNDYKAIIMEWNNPRRFHPEWKNEWRYHPQIVTGTNKNKVKIPVIWADSLAFQKFQRYVHGEIGIDEYLQFIQHQSGGVERYFPMYSNDVEIFDFRPGRYKTEANIDGEQSEWNRIKGLFKRIQNDDNLKLVFPSQIITGSNNPDSGNEMHLESPEQPIPVKKQEKYNINRWALTGRNDLQINSQCFKIYNQLTKDPKRSEKDFKELCYLWSSDFRTHITDKRWQIYNNRLCQTENRFFPQKKKSQSPEWNPVFEIPVVKNEVQCTEQGRYIEIKNNNIKLKLNRKKGCAIDAFIVKDLSSHALMGTLDHGYFDDITFGADFFSGHTIIERPGDHKITDLSPEKQNILENNNDLIIQTQSVFPDVKISKSISIQEDKLMIEKIISLDQRQHEIIRPFHFTINPETFDSNTLFYSTHNGGVEWEYFSLHETSFQHHRILSQLISSKHGLGATKGMVRIGDKEKEIMFRHDYTMSALIPSIEFQWMDKGIFFLRLVYSAQEIDDTFRPNDQDNIIQTKIEISASKR